MRSQIRLLCALAFLTTSVLAGEVPFDPAKVVDTGLPGIREVVTGDLDRDGVLDLVAAVPDENLVLYFEGRGDGTWEPPVVVPRNTIAAGGAPGNVTDVILLDVDRDGDLDIAWCAADDDQVGWNRNRLDSENPEPFDEAVLLSLGESLTDPRALAVGDFDLDGGADLVALGDFRAVVWLNRTIDDLDPPLTAYSFSDEFDPEHTDIVAGDVTGDGVDDLAIVSLSAGVVLQVTNAQQSPFWASEEVTSLSGGLAVTIGNLGGDGRDSIVVTFETGIIAYRYFGVGFNGGLFGTREITSDPESWYDPHVIDFDRDGEVDILALASDPPRLSRFEFDGKFWGEYQVNGAPGETFRSLAIGDFDRDGDRDVAIGIDSTGRLVSFRNRTIHRSARFLAEDEILASESYNEMTYGQVDDDGDLDIVAGSGSSGIGDLLRGTGFGFFLAPIEIGTDFGALSDVTLADLDQDGDPDLIAAHEELSWVENLGDGAFGSEVDIRTALQGTFLVTVAVDLDRDGDLDVVAGGNGLTGNGLEGAAAAFYENNGTPGVGDWPADPIEENEDASVTAVAVGDLDGNGAPDVVLGGLIGGDATVGVLAWYRAVDLEGTLAFDATTIDSFGMGTAVSGVAVGDTDLDGDLDVVAATSAGVRVYENPGSGAVFTFDPVPASAGFESDLTLRDLDQDGDLDLVSIRFDDLIWYENDGGSFLPPAGIGFADGGIDDLEIFDVDVDGDDDLVFTTPASSAIRWHANRGGQYALGSEDGADLTVYEGEEASLLAIDVRVNARPGDSPGKIEYLELRWEGFELIEGEPEFFPLDTAEVSSLVETLRIYRDEGSGTFEKEQDVLVATVENLAGPFQSVTFDDPDDPNLRVAAPARFFVVIEPAPGASGDFRLVHEAEYASLLDANFDILLQAEPTTAAASGVATPAVAIVVGTTADETDTSPGDGTCQTASGCSLRGAIQEANALPDLDRIILPAGNYVLTIPGAGEDAGATGDLDITGDLILEGAGADRTTIDAAGLDRALHVIDASVELRGITVLGGDAPGACVDDTSSGGGLRIESGAVRIVRTAFRDNRGCASGGGISSTNASVELEGVTVSGNVATRGAGVDSVGVDFAALNTTISGNAATEGFEGGGGVRLAGPGTATIVSSTIAFNVANGSGAGLLIEDEGGAPTVGVGNTIVAENVTTSFLGGSSTDDIDGVIQDDGFNLIGFEPDLGNLQDNGGTTFTHGLLPGSAAIDQGNCPPGSTDQRGAIRPVDLPQVGNPGDGCDIGAYEAAFGETVVRVEIPVRWCGVEGAPTLENPPPGMSTNDVMRNRHELASDNIWRPQANVTFRSAANIAIPDYPILSDPNPGVGNLGDVAVDPALLEFDEFFQLIADCRAAWQAADPDIVGLTAVHINRFVDPQGNPLGLLGLGGRAMPGNAAQQMISGRVMVVDPVYRASANPPDLVEVLLGHELGHAISLEHGDGQDNDQDGVVDNDDDQVDGLPKFDGPGLMQYRNGTLLTIPQMLRARTHALVTIPDVSLSPQSSVASDDAPIDSGFEDILDFGFEDVLDFGFEDILDFGFEDVLDFGFEDILDFGFEDILDFGFEDVLDFGMTFEDGGFNGVGEATLYASVAGPLWPTPIRPDSTYYFYANLDNDTSTGGNPGLDPDGEFPAGMETGIELVLKVEVGATCTGQTCTDVTVLRVFERVSGDDFDETSAQAIPRPDQVGVGLYFDNGGDVVEDEEQLIGVNVEAKVPLETLLTNGWPLGATIRLEVLALIDCTGDVPSGIATLRCADSPDLPPDVDPAEILLEDTSAEIAFTPPVLPGCVLESASFAPGGPLTIRATSFPTNLQQPFEVYLDDAPEPIFVEPSPTFEPDGSVLLALTVPEETVPGPREFEVVLNDFATTAACEGLADPDACADFDGDTLCDDVDPDDDNDGVDDVDDPADNDATVCGDVDGDTCDDCTSGTFDRSADGADFDGDGACDAGDPDDDDDGVADENDPDDNDAMVCGDNDVDTCDDCSSGSFDRQADGPDFDGDGLCDAGDPDDDNDGVGDESDPNDADPSVCGDGDLDTCDDCSSGTLDPAADGPDLDGDGLCDAGDPDDDNDGVDDGEDPDDTDDTVCGDSDLDTCDDCTSGTFDPSADGPDADGDGICDAGDNDDDEGDDEGDDESDDEGDDEGDDENGDLGGFELRTLGGTGQTGNVQMQQNEQQHEEESTGSAADRRREKSDERRKR